MAHFKNYLAVVILYLKKLVTLKSFTFELYTSLIHQQNQQHFFNRTKSYDCIEHL